MRRRRGTGRTWRSGGTALATLALVASLAACQGEDDDPEQRGPGEAAASATPTVPPTPSEELGLAEGWGPDRGELDRAAEAVRRMRLPALAGQVIVAEWSGTAAPVDLVRRLHLGGVIAFDSNVVSAEQVRAVNTRLTRRVGRKWPLFLGVDQEGGVVERLRGAATRFPTFMSAGAAGDVALTERAYAASGAELRGLGFTVDFAPDADVTSGPGDPTIGSRAASSYPSTVAEHVVAAATGFAASGVLPVVKHFPGHGSVPGDSHLTLPVQAKSRKELEATDLVPFRGAVEAGLPAVMIGHLDVRAVDPGVPSSLSRKVVTGLLRQDLGFGGLVVTDALDMAGVTRGRDPGRTAVQALRAGSDVLLMPPSPAVARAAVVRAVRSGALPRRRLEQAAARQVALLTHLDGRAGAPVGTARGASRSLSAAAVTMVAGECAGRLVGDQVHAYGDPGAVSVFAAAAGRAGLGVLLRKATPTRLARAVPQPERRKGERRKAYQKRKRAWRRAEARREERLAAWVAREDARLAAGTPVGFTGFRDAPVDGDVAVATDSPWVLGRVSAPTRIATYGDTPAAMDVLVEVLLGRAPAPGRLPVRVGGVERSGCRA
ncbi:glycoside hydrolase family 3 N-terminal domain-containing protein [Microbacterium sp. ARD31]|uniref:glycoside hydrolase family 3 protein n=1 Tax=Microbacterium sp. ARD31 TaxID=2962576 RepID=UPI0028819E43|nr:glycoside hydrolase family 3 N-terminal domain-containing protein [Microbacterium sp. ARD31]MDT0187769.1 glycoside hydrolase family 3 N-terminal domain-containing protein [Microbacterium sp. ARD31]